VLGVRWRFFLQNLWIEVVVEFSHTYNLQPTTLPTVSLKDIFRTNPN